MSPLPPGHRVQEHHGSGAEGEDRDSQGGLVELVLADLADDGPMHMHLGARCSSHR